MSGSWAGGRGCRPAVDIALEHINDKPDLLPGFSLKMLANDSQVLLPNTYHAVISINQSIIFKVA